MTPTILVFDSGLGGLTVFREVAEGAAGRPLCLCRRRRVLPLRPARTKPSWSPACSTVMEQLIAAHRPDLVVVACNTASTLVLPQLRERFKVPFVGTVPAIKPACAASSSQLVSVLGTEATVKREYTRALIRELRRRLRA